MPVHADGWSFLVARGRQRGYRTLLAPEFLTERDLHGRLSESTSGAQPGRILCIELECPGVGLLTVMYTTDSLRPADVNGDGPAEGGAPTDEHGRPLELLYGIVSRDRLSGDLDEGDLQIARTEALHSYRRFLAAEDSFGVDTSRGFALRTEAVAAGALRRPVLDEAASAPPRLAPPQRPARRRPALGAALAAGVLVAVVLLGLLLWPGGSTEVRILSASIVAPKGAVACRTPAQLRLRAVIEADGATKVRYHWEPKATTAPLSDDVALTFDAAGTKTVAATATVPRPGAAPKASFRLVIEVPVQEKRMLATRLSCRNASRAGAAPLPRPHAP